MKGLVKGILAIGTAIAVGCVIYKKVKENKEEAESKEEVIIEENQELSEEKQDLYNKVRAQVRKEMKPYMRRVNICRFVRVIVGIFITANMGVYLACLEAERQVNVMKEGVVAC